MDNSNDSLHVSPPIPTDTTISSNNNIIDLMECPVCRMVMMLPRMFGCGHSMCSPCHKKYDEGIDRAYRLQHHVSQLRLSHIRGHIEYQCPVCREPSLQRWMHRPINYCLWSIIKKYYHIDADVSAYMEPRIYDTPITSMDLRKLAEDRNKSLTLDVYTKLIPILVNAAEKGLMFVEFTSADLVTQIIKCIKRLSPMLFFRNNIYMVTLGPMGNSVYFVFSKNANGVSNDRFVHISDDTFSFRNNDVIYESDVSEDPTNDEDESNTFMSTEQSPTRSQRGNTSLRTIDQIVSDLASTDHENESGHESGDDETTVDILLMLHNGATRSP